MAGTIEQSFLSNDTSVYSTRFDEDALCRALGMEDIRFDILAKDIPDAEIISGDAFDEAIENTKNAIIRMQEMGAPEMATKTAFSLANTIIDDINNIKQNGLSEEFLDNSRHSLGIMIRLNDYLFSSSEIEAQKQGREMWGKLAYPYHIAQKDYNASTNKMWERFKEKKEIQLASYLEKIDKKARKRLLRLNRRLKRRGLEPIGDNSLPYSKKERKRIRQFEYYINFAEQNIEKTGGQLNILNVAEKNWENFIKEAQDYLNGRNNLNMQETKRPFATKESEHETSDKKEKTTEIDNSSEVTNKKNPEETNKKKEQKEAIFEEGRILGVVKNFDAKKGYGFITADNGSDYFVHFSAIQGGSEFRTLNEGERVEFEIEKAQKGLKAVNVVKENQISQDEINDDFHYAPEIPDDAVVTENDFYTDNEAVDTANINLPEENKDDKQTEEETVNQPEETEDTNDINEQIEEREVKGPSEEEMKKKKEEEKKADAASIAVPLAVAGAAAVAATAVAKTASTAAVVTGKAAKSFDDVTNGAGFSIGKKAFELLEANLPIDDVKELTIKGSNYIAKQGVDGFVFSAVNEDKSLVPLSKDDAIKVLSKDPGSATKQIQNILHPEKAMSSDEIESPRVK